MADLSDDFRDLRADARMRRERRLRKNRADLLTLPPGVRVQELAATHWRVRYGTAVIDLWPTTNRARAAHGSSLVFDGWLRKGLADLIPLLLSHHSTTETTAHARDPRDRSDHA